MLHSAVEVKWLRWAWRGQVRTLGSQVRLDARTKLLNPKWYEGMLSSGYEGVREIQKRLTNTVGWSATSGQVDNWVYDEVRSQPAALISSSLRLSSMEVTSKWQWLKELLLRDVASVIALFTKVLASVLQSASIVSVACTQPY